MQAFDRMPFGTVRSVDEFGKLHIEVSNISKATVNPYYGKEIPGWDSLGLDADRIYQMFRDPDELAKAAPTFNKLPLLDEHVEVSSVNPEQMSVVGATGESACFEHPYLTNSLVVWTADAISGIEDDSRREISCAYRYKPVMEPGEYEGVRFDGRMTDIVGNHVALVREGRAGPDVVVGDEQLEHSNMKLSRKAIEVKGALTAFIAPRLAADQKVGDLSPILKGLTAKNYAETKRRIADSAAKRYAGKLAADQSAEAEEFLASIEALSPTPEEVSDEEGTEPGAPAARSVQDVIAALKAELGDDGFAELVAALAPTGDDKPGDDMDPRGSDEKPGEKEEKVDKAAMDAAIKAAVEVATKLAEDGAVKRQREIRDAEKYAAKKVGELNGAFDSAEDVLRAACGVAGVDVKGVTGVPALKVILDLVQAPGAKRAPAMAADSSGVKSLYEMFPLAKNA